MGGPPGESLARERLRQQTLRPQNGSLHCKAQSCATGRPQHASPCDVNDMYAGATLFSPVGTIANLHENNGTNDARAGE
ncbi:hypothetical protein E4K66_01830 [Bradyrhizobium frederickii]|uniref:Uncharacterized protein n=1 Tax=Bradyrhizobium frederickii TaxID=2560054 RepID=A0A4Y9LIE6_9BRAD|nr:hypothetical protein E4K66_01830 [Bradyrhizobium frederickii]